MKRFIRNVLLLTVLLGGTITVNSQTQQALFDRANAAYTAVQYDSAIMLYQQLTDSGIMSEKLFYNLGNAYYKSGNYPFAILYFEKALKINPGSADIRHNLQISQKFVTDKVDAVPRLILVEWFHAVSRSLSYRRWQVVAVTSFLLLLLLIAVYARTHRHSVKIMCGIANPVLLIVVIFSHLFFFNQQKSLLATEAAIVITQRVEVKSEPVDRSPNLFVVHSGLKVMIEPTDKINDYTYISLPNGTKGWVLSKAIAEI